MKTFLVVISIILIAIVMLYAWYNRESDRVTLTFVTAIILATLGFITKESISNKIEESSKEFPIAVFYSSPRYHPLNINLPYMQDLMICMQSIKNKDLPKNNNNVADIGYGSKIYFQALQYSIISSLIHKYSGAWSVKSKKITTPSGEILRWESLDYKGEKVTVDNIMLKIPDNYFVQSKLYKTYPISQNGTMLLPPDTSFVVENKSEQEFIMTLKNKFVTISLKLSAQGSSIGIGEYASYFDFPTISDGNSSSLHNASKCGNSTYLLETKIVQNILLNGHPDMKKYRNWADSIVDFLDNKFNYEEIRKKHIENYRLQGMKALYFVPYHESIFL